MARRNNDPGEWPSVDADFDRNGAVDEGIDRTFTFGDSGRYCAQTILAQSGERLTKKFRSFSLCCFPFAAYALMVAGGLLLLTRPEISLDLVAAGMLVLVCLVIRNESSRVENFQNRSEPTW